MTVGCEQLLRAPRPPRYPWNCAPAVDPEPGAPLERRVAARPGRFLVGFESKPLRPPREKVKGVSLSEAAYVGRVEEVLERDVTVRLWARPSGWEGLTTLALDDGMVEIDQQPAVGDLLWIWTWVDLQRTESGEREDKRVLVEVEHRKLTAEDHARIRALVEEHEEDRR